MKHILNTFLLSSIVIFIVSCNKQGVKVDDRRESFQIVEVPIKTITGYTSFPASIEGKTTNSVRAKISGYIQELYVDEGQMITKGQPLFKLETNTLNQTANAAKSAIVASEAAVNVAQVEVDKLVPLVEKNIVSSIQLETAKANLARAKSQLESVKADYQSVAANINYSVIKSPISGIIGALPFKVGSLVGPADPTPLTFISDNSEVYAYFSMNEKDYFDFLQNTKGETIKEKLNNLPEVSLRLANNEIYDEKGKIESITGQIDPVTGTVRFRAVFDNKKGLLSNGNSGAILIPKEYKDVLVVPETATFEQQGLVYVYAVENDTVKSRIVNVVNRINRMVVVGEGLKQDDKIVVSGLNSLRNGAVIEPELVQFDSIINSIKSTF